MNIGLYIDTTTDKQPRGIGLHTSNLLHELIDLDHDNSYFLYYPRSLTNGMPLPAYSSPHGNFHLRPIKFPRHWTVTHPRAWWDAWLPFQIRRDRLDVYHCPSHFLPSLRGSKLVTTIHDVAYFTFDDLYAPDLNATLREWTSRSLSRADRIIALSQNTATDLEKLGVTPKRIRTIHGGGNIVPTDHIRDEKSEEVRARYGLRRNYILYVGTLHPRKNITLLLKSFAKLRRDRGVRHQLVLVGLRASATAEVLRVIDDLELSTDVVITGYVEDWEIPLFYRMADVYVLPSQYEGFGMTVVEAMAYGVPVIAADTSCLREVVGDAGLLVPSDDVPALSQALSRVLEDDSLRAALAERGKVQCQSFSWRECARQTLEVYREVAENNT